MPHKHAPPVPAEKPRRIPPLPTEPEVRPTNSELARSLTDNVDFVRQYLSAGLEKNALARLGYDMDRTVTTGLDLNVTGAYATGAYLPPETRVRDVARGLSSAARLQLYERAPHLYEQGDVTLLGNAGQWHRDRGATVLHEFTHRGIQRLREGGFQAVGKFAAEGVEATAEDGRLGVELEVGRGRVFLDEEALVRLMDWQYGPESGRPEVLSYMKRRYGFSEDFTRDRVLGSSGLNKFLDVLHNEAAREIEKGGGTSHRKEE